MNPLIHILLGIIICILINLKIKLSRGKSFLFVLGSMLPDLGYLASFAMTGSLYAYPRGLFHNVFLVLLIAIFRNLFLLGGVLLHFSLDLISHEPWNIFYPVANIKVGLEQLWLDSPVVNAMICVAFLLSLVFGRGFVWRKRSGADLLRFGLMFMGSLTFLFGNAIAVGGPLVLAGFFIDDEYMRSVYRARVVYFCGIDGSGKSTHAEETVNFFRGRGIRIVCEHFFKNPLVSFLSGIKRKAGISKREEVVTYSPEFEKHVKRHLLPKMRAYLVFLDNLFYIGSKILWHKLRGEWVIADRFFYDYFLRLKLLGYNVRGLGGIYGRLFPKYGVTLDLAPQIAYRKRREHPVWYYVKAREEYLKIAEKRKYPIFRTDRPFNEVQREINKYFEGIK